MCLFDRKASRTLMGHRRSSHVPSRASKRGSPEMVSTYSKDKYDKNGEGREAHERSRREKRERKRKREHEDSSKKKHKEKHKGKNRHHKTKEKPKDRVSRRKDSRASDYMSSESDSGTSFVSSKGAYRNHRSRSRSLNTNLPRERSIADVPNAYRLKRFKGNNEDDFRQIREASKDLQVENDGLRHCSNEHFVQVKDIAEGTKPKRRYSDIQQDGCDVSIQRNQEQKRPIGRKDKVLEVELRQKALANLLRHQDVSCKMDEQKERISPPTNATRPALKNEQSERAVTDVDSRRTTRLPPGDAVSVDAPIDACANNTNTHVSQNSIREGSELACNSGSNLEEGEIGSDNEYETGREDARCVVDEKNRVLHDEEETLKTGEEEEARKGVCEEQHKVRLTSAEKEREVERFSTGVDVAATSCIDEKRELSQGKAVEDPGNVDVAATAGHDGSDSSFQQKTMSVMRGGEMVQVSYKVYIPKRAAELARKRLQR